MKGLGAPGERPKVFGYFFVCFTFNTHFLPLVIVLPGRVLLRGFSYRFDYGGNICFLLQLLQHPALEPPIGSKVEQEFEFIAFL